MRGFWLIPKQRDRTSIDPTISSLVEASGLFDPEWYVAQYPDVRGFKGGPLAHFCLYGMRENRDPGPRFSTRAYLRRVPRAIEARVPVFVHALAHAAVDLEDELWAPEDSEALRLLVVESGLFDAGWYLAEHPDVARSGRDPLSHFVEAGAIERRDPGPNFETDVYVDRYPEAGRAYPSPLEHYLRVGRAQNYIHKGPPIYERWIAEHDDLTDKDEARIRDDAAALLLPPVTIVCVCDAAAFARMGDLLEAVRAQIGISWIARFSPCSDVAPQDWLSFIEAEAPDPRIRFLDHAARAASDIQDGSMLLLCAGASLLRAHACYAFASALRDASIQAAYSDHDHLVGGLRSRPFFKPEMSPEYLKRSPYVGSVLAFMPTSGRRDDIETALASLGADDLVREAHKVLLTMSAGEVARVPLILYHALGQASSDPSGEGERPEVDADDVVPASALPSVTIVIPTRDRVELLRACVESIRTETAYPRERVEIVVVDNGSLEDETLDYLRELSSTQAALIVPSPGKFNFSKINNDGAAAASGEIVVFLNNDTTVNRRDWLSKLVDFARRPEIGAVGAQLLYPDGTIQHGGVVLGVLGVGAHRLVGVRPDGRDPCDVTREMTSLTGACLAVRRDVFLSAGGFDPVLEVAFNDVALCSTLAKAGFRNIYVAEPLLYHHESKSRGFDDTRTKIRRNLREAIHARTRFSALFQNDPCYSPNLSLQKVGDLAFPPRIVRPWRRSRQGQRRILLLSGTHQLGQGVPAVLGRQAAYFKEHGWDVTVGGPERPGDIEYPDCARVVLTTPQQAASYAVSHGVDCVVAHTPPFFSITRLLGEFPLAYFFDHGEPNPEFFAERDVREMIDWEKRLCATNAKRVFTISQTIARQQYREDAIVVRNGNSHLATWSPDWMAARTAFRQRHGLQDKFVVLNVCRFREEDRHYKGVGKYVEVANDFPFLHPECKSDVVFLIAGRGSETDTKLLRSEGLEVFPNVSDSEMRELYAAADLFMNFSRWEGYNLGIGQALAMGLRVIASDIEAHREFPIFAANDVPVICLELSRHVARRNAEQRESAVVVEDWNAPLAKLEAVIREDVDRYRTSWL